MWVANIILGFPPRLGGSQDLILYTIYVPIVAALDYLSEVKKMPLITSPPKGRDKREKNVHDLSRSSSEEETPKPKKKRNKTLGGVSDLQNYLECDRIQKKIC